MSGPNPELAAFLAYRSTYPQALADGTLVEERERLKSAIADMQEKFSDHSSIADELGPAEVDSRHSDLCDELDSLQTDLDDVRAEITARGLKAGSAR